MRTPLDADAIDAALSTLPGWAHAGSKLTKTFVFDDFGAAMAWMQRVAPHADRLDHHPNWSNVYRTVEVELWTHDVGGVTELDVRLASAMEGELG